MKKISLLAVLLISQSALSQTTPEFFQWEPNDLCVEGKSSSIEVGTSSSFDSLKVENVPDHIIIGSSHRIKGDGPYYLAKGDRVYFYDSLGGYRGSHNAKTDGNAYLTYTFSEVLRTGSQEGWVWVVKGLPSTSAENPYYLDNPFPEFCSKKKVYFQERAPSLEIRVTKDSTDGNTTGTVRFSGEQDNYYSKNALEGKPVSFHLQKKVISEWTGKLCNVVEETARWRTVVSRSTSSSYSFDESDCLTQYRVRSFDGYYYSPWEHFSVWVTRDRPAPPTTTRPPRPIDPPCTGFICEEEP